MRDCLVCSGPVDTFISFGRMPIANGFLTRDQFANEYFFELKTGFCPRCTMVQLTEQVDRAKMFHDEYAFFSSTSTRMAAHFRQFANSVLSEHLNGPESFVVEIGSNDGIMLQNFLTAGVKHLGIEPSTNVADVARAKGVHTISRFFDEELAREIVSDYGKADAFLGANVMCHLPYLHSVAAGVKILLKPQGVLIFEDPYMGDIVEKTSYDQIYDEHAFYFSVRSLSNLFAPHDLEIVDVVPQNVHGGSMRYVIAHKGSKLPTSAVAAQMKKEEQLALHKPETYDLFRQNVERSREQVLGVLTKLKDERQRVVGYGATSKSTTVTNYCGITPDLVEFISDTTPIKQGKFSPGVHIPVRPYEEFVTNYPPYSLLFAWNHGEEIMEKEEDFQRAGGKWITYVPKVTVS